MPIETFFPLAIYYEDLPEAAQHQQQLLETVLQLEHEGLERRAYAEMAWTGDLHGVAQIHQDARFAWVVGQVELHVQLYLASLGIDLSKVALYIQRAWPVVSRPGQEVGDHCHNTAHVSAVYYLSVPETGGEMGETSEAGDSELVEEIDELDPGCLVFFDDARVNEVCPGLGSENTDILDPDSLLGMMQVVYPPVEGRLMIFPAKQRHGVTMNESQQMRVSLSFDIVLTATKDMAGAYEFLTPPPGQWRSFGAG
jgi:hypothetical protein